MFELVQSARLIIFAMLLLTFASWEHFFPRRPPAPFRERRWIGNIGILAIGTLLARLILPLAPISVAVWAREVDVGLLNWLNVPWLVSGAIAFLVLDLAVYAQHVAFHRVPLLWRIHRMHHSDTDLDVTTGLRFHPAEIILSLALKMAVVALLGAPPTAVLIFEVVLNTTSMFNHAAINLPVAADRLLRWVLVTPDMHRVHHSIHKDETDSNFGFNIPWWDRVFGTYKAQPKDGHAAMTLGLPNLRDERAFGVINLLVQPFIRVPPTPQDTTRARN